jgi:hypothetical protein
MQHGNANNEQTLLTLPRSVKPPAWASQTAPPGSNRWGWLDRARNRPYTKLFKTYPNHFEHLANAPRSPSYAQISPLFDNAWIKAKCEKSFNIELLKYTKFITRCYTHPNEQVRYSIASYELKLQDHKVSQPLGEAMIEFIIFVKSYPLTSKVLNISKTCQNGKATQTTCYDNHSKHKIIINTHKHLMSCPSNWAMCLFLYMRLLIGRHHATV